MTPTEHDRSAPTRGALLREVLKQRGIGHKTFARMIVGADAPDQAVENKRTEVKRWTKPSAGFSDENAAIFERVLELPAGYFKTAARRRGSSAAADDQTEELRRRLAALEGEHRKLRDEFDAALQGVLERLAALEAAPARRAQR